MKTSLGIAIALATALCATSSLAAPNDVHWPFTGADQHFSRYSPANQINRANVSGLKILWTRPAIDPSLSAEFPVLQTALRTGRSGPYFRSTPIEVGGVVYASNGVGLVEAFEAGTGKTIWVQRPFSSAPADLAGGAQRGVAMWRSGNDSRIISARGAFLYSLDAKTGKPDTAFGENGRVSLVEGDRRGGANGAPIVVGDVIILGAAGNGPGVAGRGDDGGDQIAAYPRVSRAYDVRTGKKIWEFSPMPAEGDPARATWGEAAGIAGAMASYGLISADEELGYVYIGYSAPNPGGFGGHRPGDNLYGDAVVALDIKTGRKIWHYQTIHHDLWDFDLASPPILGDVKSGGKTVKALMIMGKVPLLYALDRVTGKPIWPIPERPVPPSTVAGERASPTQPIPSRPEPIGRLEFTENDLIDFTPDLRRQAQEIVSKYYTIGKAFQPSPLCSRPSGPDGVLMLPGSDGGGMWSSGSFDPDTNTYYTVVSDTVSAHCMENPTAADATLRYKKRGDLIQLAPMGPQGLPLIKPPYSHFVAVDMTNGRVKWRVPNGEGPRNNPLLKGLNLPMLGNPGKPAVAVTKELIFVGEGASTMLMAPAHSAYGDKFRAYDKRNGKILAEVKLPAGTSGAPITYSVGGKQMVLVAVSGAAGQPDWVDKNCPPADRACGAGPLAEPVWVAMGL
ncbi:hypothetical protein [Phenylobacterium sp.]|jgi:glucose dehydrogenase|uniref:hypothetical protein n=1 Tax=Phenylobacterium sp. TaxID=1871053 RepID=UPI0037838365